MQPWRRRVCRDVVCRSIALDLVDAVKRDVEPISSFVLNDRDFDGSFAHIHLLDTTVDTDTVLEVNDVIARLERGKTLQCGARRVPSRAAEASLAAKDLVVRQHAITGEIAVAGRNHESAIEHPDRQTRRRYPIVVQQLVEALGL